MSISRNGQRPAYLLVQGCVTDREGTGSYFVAILGGRPDPDG